MPPKAILIVDKCTAHEELKSDDGNIIVFPLPPNVTSVLQPMDQSPIKVVKTKYCNKFLAFIVAKEDTPIEKSLKEHTIRDAIEMLKDAWANIPFTLLQNAWSKIHDWDKDDYTDEDLLPLSIFQISTDYYQNLLDEMQTFLNQIAPTSEISAAEIEEWNDDVIDESLEFDDVHDSNSESDGEAAALVSHTNALDDVNELIEWCTQNEEIGSKHTANLLSLRSDIVTTLTTTKTKQKSITDFFK